MIDRLEGAVRERVRRGGADGEADGQSHDQRSVTIYRSVVGDGKEKSDRAADGAATSKSLLTKGFGGGARVRRVPRSGHHWAVDP
ncbi:hypothetical protein [Nonomuraea fuscirosea]|uniref:hypothetical protein n=1 Tax=Nonomuraea fuscirosea TaxID=1291556 RepID=UPI0011B253BE|nr:hypothetical protein [Nonomuraea fuscirosea]